MALLAVVALLALLPTPGNAGVPAQFYGVSPTLATLSPADLERMAGGGTDMVRVSVRWNRAQRTENGPYDWRATDWIFEHAARNGIQVLPVIQTGTPSWIAPLPTTPPIYSDNPDAASQWRDFVRAVAERYGDGGSFWAERPELVPLPVGVYEIWNEMNGPPYWTGGPVSAADYARLLTLADAGIDAVDPEARLMVGGLRPRTAVSYLDDLYDVAGVRDHFELVGLHPYAKTAYESMSVTRNVRALMDARGDTDTGIWLTEVGWSTSGSGGVVTTLQGQADRTESLLTRIGRQRLELRIGRVLLYSYEDDPAAPCGWCPGAGLIEADGTAKPAWRVFTAFAAGV